MIFFSQGWCAVRSEGVQEGVQLGGRVCSKVGGCAVRWEGVQKGSEGVQLGKRWSEGVQLGWSLPEGVQQGYSWSEGVQLGSVENNCQEGVQQG